VDQEAARGHLRGRGQLRHLPADRRQDARSRRSRGPQVHAGERDERHALLHALRRVAASRGARWRSSASKPRHRQPARSGRQVRRVADRIAGEAGGREDRAALRIAGARVMGSANGSLWDNPLGTDGFEFVEYAAPDPAALGRLFEQLGFSAVAKHRSKNVLLYRQGDVNFIVNAEPNSFAQSFARVHGPSICAIAFRVRDAAYAYRQCVENGAWGVESHPGPMELNIPAIKGIGDSLIYLVDRYPGSRAEPNSSVSIYDVAFVTR